MESLKEVLEKAGGGENSSKMQKSLSLFLLAATLLVLVYVVAGIMGLKFVGQGQNPMVATINVTGEGEVVAIPDVAKVTFSVITEASTTSGAQEKASKDMNAIIEGLKKEGVEEKDIKTSNYYLTPKYDYRQEYVQCITFPCPPIGRQVLTGYEVNQSVDVTIRKTEDAGKLVALAGELGATNISGLSFVVEDEDELRAEARGLAISDARAKAKKLAKDLDVRLVRVISYSDNQFYPVYAKAYGAEMGMGGGVMDSAVVPDLPTGETKINAQVSISYEIR